MRLAVDRDIPEAASAFAAFGDVSLIAGRAMTAEAIGDATVLIVRSVTKVNADLLRSTAIEFVATATSGIDHLDTAYLANRKIPYFSAPGCNARAVAEFILACVLLHAMRNEQSLPRLQAGIIGYGNIGRMVESMLSAVGVNCVINDPLLADRDPARTFVDMDTLLESDIVTLHVPYTTRGEFPTHNLVGQREFDRLGTRALLINASRGGVVDERAWTEWIKCSNGSGSVVDCWRGEPFVNLKLLEMAEIATPHVAGHAREARLRATAMLVEQLSGVLGIENAWRPLDVDVIEMHLESSAFPEAIREAVLTCCDPRILTAALRGTIGLPERGRGTEFDRFRRDASRRREFGSRQIAAGTLRMDIVEMLGMLGFATTPSEIRNDD